MESPLCPLAMCGLSLSVCIMIILPSLHYTCKEFLCLVHSTASSRHKAKTISKEQVFVLTQLLVQQLLRGSIVILFRTLYWTDSIPPKPIPTDLLVSVPDCKVSHWNSALFHFNHLMILWTGFLQEPLNARSFCQPIIIISPLYKCKLPPTEFVKNNCSVVGGQKNLSLCAHSSFCYYVMIHTLFSKIIYAHIKSN